jgi:predicted GIY-YIG superfamily endonuclease
MMTKYYVYCLKQKGVLIYVGSTTKITDRMKSHTKDKVFDEMWYCELPNKEIMLEVEAYYISQKNPQLNKTKPSYTITETPEYIKWIQANLDFLHTEPRRFRD